MHATSSLARLSRLALRERRCRLFYGSPLGRGRAFGSAVRSYAVHALGLAQARSHFSAALQDALGHRATPVREE